MTQAASRRSHRGVRRPAPVVLLMTAVLSVAVVLGVAASLSVTVRAASPSSAPTAARKIVLRIGVTEDADNLNPFIGYNDTAYDVFSQNYEYLVERRPQDFGPGPDGIAQSWEHSADGKVWTFHLHHDIAWQDGQPLTADDVVFTYNYIIQNQMSGFASAVQGIVKAVKVDDYTVQLVCSAAKSNILRLWIPILPKHIWEHVSPKAAGTSFANDPPLVGSGPFQVTEWKRGSYIVMKANKHYWLGAPKIDELIFQVYSNPAAMVDDLKTGLLGAAQPIPVAQFKQLQHTQGITTDAYSFFNWDYLCFNSFTGAASLGNPVLRDSRFRVALDYAIDRQKLASVAYSGLADPGTTILPPDTWADPDYHWQPPAGMLRTYNPAKAKALLDAAGYPLKNGVRVDHQGKPITLRLWALTSSAALQSAGKLISGNLKSLGLKIQFQVVDEGVYNSRVWNFKGNTYAPDFDMYLWNWSGYADPSQTLGSFITSQIGNWNEPCWSNPQYDRAFTLQSHELDPQKRQKDAWQAQQVMYADNPESVITYPKLLQAVNSGRWTGWIHTGIDNTGPMFFAESTQKEYLTVQPVSATKSGSNSWIWAVVAAVVVVVIVVGLVVWRRRRTVAEEVG